MKVPSLGLRLVLALALTGAALSAAQEPIYSGLGAYSRKVTTKSAEAQRYFDQGFAWFHGFHHGAAIRGFQEAARLDPECAMAHWGIALANGPHINLPMVPPPAAEQAWQEITLARKYAANASPVERELIAALAARFAHPQPEDRSPLDRAYADAMRKVWKDHPTDPDVGALFAESLMTLRPWDQWTPEGKPQPGTEEALATIEAVFKLNLNHPFANHLYIHAMEASHTPERAVAAAERLRDLQPGLPHNVHMPSHIDIRNGRWQEAITANVKAIEAARRLRAAGGPPPQGPIYIYNAHNHHMLAYAAMMTGQSELAISQIRTMAAMFPEDFLRDFAPFVDPYVAMPYEVLLRFGRWDDVLAAPDHPAHLPFARAMRLAARGIAYAAKGDTTAARREQQAYLAMARTIPPGTSAGPVDVQTIIAVATPMLEGEILYRDGKTDEGLAALRGAVKAEDALRYFEPPAWFLPVRHALGAALMRSGNFAEAEQVYREDLRRLPENGWSLFGLAESLRMRGMKDEAAAVQAHFEAVWRVADIQIKSSCMCQPGVELAATTP
jgi:tetratricopeptide (TPR) repeat protein